MDSREWAVRDVHGTCRRITTRIAGYVGGEEEIAGVIAGIANNDERED